MKYLLIFSLSFFPHLSHASDEADNQALAEVQALLQNPQVIKGPAGNPDEKAALAEIDKLTKGDPKTQQGINQLSSDIFADMVKKEGAGEGGIMRALLEAQQNPGKFIQTLSPEQRQRLRELASEIDKKNESPKK